MDRNTYGQATRSGVILAALRSCVNAAPLMGDTEEVACGWRRVNTASGTPLGRRRPLNPMVDVRMTSGPTMCLV